MINVDVEAYRKDLESSWLWKIWNFVADNWMAIAIIIVCIVVARVLFNNLIFPHHFETFKTWFGLENTLANMKSVLEEDYSELWHESEFCLAFLTLQDEQQRLCRLAKSNSKGENPQRFHWANRYSKINIK